MVQQVCNVNLPSIPPPSPPSPSWAKLHTEMIGKRALHGVEKGLLGAYSGLPVTVDRQAAS